MKSKIEYIWHRIKMGQTLNSIAKRNGIEDWKVLYEHNRDLLRNPNILNYIDEDIYDIGWCINNKQGVVRIPVLNSQDQEENEPEKVYVDPIVPDFIAEKLAEERYNTREILLNGTKPLEVEDTPEQKEEWEFDLRNLMYRDGEQLRSAGEGKPYTGEYRELVVSMIKNLLSEREREAREEGFREGADIVESDYIRKVKKLEKRLSKLTTK